VRRSHPSDGRLALLALTGSGEELMGRLFPVFNAEEAFVTRRLSAAQCLAVADGLRQVVSQLEDAGEQRRLDLLAGATPAPRRGARPPPRPLAPPRRSTPANAGRSRRATARAPVPRPPFNGVRPLSYRGPGGGRAPARR